MTTVGEYGIVNYAYLRNHTSWLGWSHRSLTQCCNAVVERESQTSSLGASIDHRKHLSESKRGIPCPAVIESNIRRRSENPSKAALANRKYRAAKKEREAHA